MAVSTDRYNDIVEKAATRAANARVKYNQDEMELESYKSPVTREEAGAKYYGQYKRALLKAMPYESVTDADLDDLEKFKDEEAMRWLDGNFRGYSPWEKAKSIEASKFLPYVYGNAKDGESWFERSYTDLKGIAAQEGYKGKDGFKEFLDKMGEYQKQFERSQNLKQFREDMGAAYWPAKIAYPSMMQEGENAIATGEGGDESTLYNMGALDALTNMGIFAIPGVAGGTVLKNSPVAAGVVDAVLQGAAEAARQGAKVGMSETGQDFDIAAPLAAGAAGATRPALVGSANMLATQLPGGTAQQFARGISMATRKGDPVAMEREGLSRSLDVLSKLVAREGAVTAAEKNSLFKANRAIKAAKSLGIKPAEILTEYDRPVQFMVKTSPETGATLMSSGGGVRNGIRFLDQPGERAYGAAFPAKLDQLNGENIARSRGLATGKVIADIGSRFEPAFKVNPYELLNGITGNSKYRNPPDYKQESWYKDLTDENKAVVDAAFKKKLEQLLND